MVRAERVFEALKQRRDAIRESDRPLVEQLLAQHETLHERLNALLPPDIDGLKIRHHGDFHLGQMLIVKDDIFIIDFEGEPRRPHAERRRKAPAARDVAGLIRSIDYSATAALARAEGRARRAWQARRGARRMGRSRHGGVPRRLSRDHDPCWAVAGRSQAAERLLNFFLLEKAFYEIDTSWLTAGLAACR